MIAYFIYTPSNCTTVLLITLRHRSTRINYQLNYRCRQSGYSYHSANTDILQQNIPQPKPYISIHAIIKLLLLLYTTILEMLCNVCSVIFLCLLHFPIRSPAYTKCCSTMLIPASPALGNFELQTICLNFFALLSELDTTEVKTKSKVSCCCREPLQKQLLQSP